MTRQDRLAEAHDRLVAAVDVLISGEDWLRFLAVARRFHTYSANNVLLILAQRPEATRVAGYKAWKALGRQVRAGERGIAILAPCTYRTRDDEDDQEARTVLRGFRVIHVFDVSQTDGDDLPAPPVAILGGDDPGLLRYQLAGLVRAERYSFTLGPLPHRYGEAFGLTDHGARAVTVSDDLPPAQQAKTTAHELAHVLLHGPDRPLTRARAEVEARVGRPHRVRRSRTRHRRLQLRLRGVVVGRRYRRHPRHRGARPRLRPPSSRRPRHRGRRRPGRMTAHPIREATTRQRKEP